MKKTLKKIVASIMAVATLSVGVTAISASAVDYTKPIGSYGEAYLSVSSGTIYATTERFSSSYSMSVDIVDYRGTVTSITRNNVNSNKVYIRYNGSGFTYAKSEHKVGTTENISIWI